MSFQNASGSPGVPKSPTVRKWVALACEGDAEINVRIVDEPEARTLNRAYRAKDYATNVLTFDYAHSTTSAKTTGSSA